MSDSLWPYVHAGTDHAVAEVPVHWMLDDGLYFLYNRRPPNYRQFFAPSAVSEIWESEFLGISSHGGVTTLILHPQLIARPSRLAILEHLVDVASNTPGVWFASCDEVAGQILNVDPS
jgi:hypothetical protein